MRRAIDGLKQVRVAAPERRVQDYPHQMSGGMKQRVVGAIAISCEPQRHHRRRADHLARRDHPGPVPALLREIQEETNLALIFITHDFGIVAKMCDRVTVMYAGRHVESGPVRDIFNHPSHPYTQALLRSVPSTAASTSPSGRWTSEAPKKPYSSDGARAHARTTVGKSASPFSSVARR